MGLAAAEATLRAPSGATNMMTIRITPNTTDGDCFEIDPAAAAGLGVDGQELHDQRAQEHAVERADATEYEAGEQQD